MGNVVSDKFADFVDLEPCISSIKDRSIKLDGHHQCSPMGKIAS